MTTSRLDTLVDIELAVWRELQACVQNRAHGWRTPVLATTDVQGNADARVLVVREVDPQARLLRFFTDARSPKLLQFAAHPRAMLVMWSPALRWQLRLAVTLEARTSGAAVSARWERLALSPAASDYLWPLAPGSELDACADTPARADVKSPAQRGHLALVDATVRSIDWLELHAQGHRRARFGPAQARWVQP